jgi:hypothetical protein
MFVPETGGCSGGNGNAAFLFLFHPVHRCRAVVNLTNAMDLLRVKQNPLGNGCFAGVNVGDDAYISSFF